MKKFTYLFMIFLWSMVLSLQFQSASAEEVPSAPSWRFDWIKSGDLLNRLAVATDSSGYQHYCYVSQRDNIIHYKTNADGWTMEEYDVGVLNSKNPEAVFKIAVNKDGEIYIVYTSDNQLRVAVTQAPELLWTTSAIQLGQVSDIDIAVDYTGKVYVAYTLDNYLFYATKIRDQWVSYVVDHKGPFLGKVSIEVDDARTIHIAYNNTPGRRVQYAAKPYYSTTWQFHTVWAYPHNNAVPWLDMSIDSMGFAHIVFSTIPFSVWPDYQSLLYMSNQTGVWEGRQIDSWDTLDKYQCAIQIDSRDIPHVIYQAGDSIKYATKPQDRWFRTVEHTAESVSEGPIDLSIDSSDYLHASYSRKNTENIVHMYGITTSPRPWEMAQVLTKNVYGKFSVAGDPLKGVHIAYSDVKKRIVYTRHSGETMAPGEPEQYVVDGNEENLKPVIGVDSMEVVHIIYQKKDMGLRYAYKSPGSIWTYSSIEPGYSPSLFTEPSGRLHLVYMQEDGKLRYAVKEPGKVNWTFHTIADDAMKYFPRVCTIKVGPLNGIHIAYFNENSQIKYAYKASESPVWGIYNIDSDCWGTFSIGLGIAPDRTVHLTYQDRNVYGLKYAKWNQADHDVEYQIIDSGVDYMGSYSSLVVDAAGLVHIAYNDTRIGALVYTNPERDSRSILDNSRKDVGAFNAMALDSHGAIHIVYMGSTSVLKLTYQRFSGSRGLLSINIANHFIQYQDGPVKLAQVITDQDKAESLFRIVPALIGNRTGYVSLESVAHPGYYLRHESHGMKLHEFATSIDQELFKKDATFRITLPLFGDVYSQKQISFESYNYPNYYIRHKYYFVYLQKDHSELFRKDSSFIMEYSEDF